MEDHYKILGIERNAKPEEVKKAYFVMAKKYHPDSGDESEIQKFHEVAEAYKVLSDSEAKKAYDLSLGSVDQEVVKVEAEPAYASTHVEKRESYRDDELREFHKNRYKKAVFRVVLMSLAVGVSGVVLVVVFEGGLVWGAIAGMCIGFSFSINQNFDVRSFFNSDKAHKIFRLFTWLFALGGLGYFVWLIMADLI